MERARQPLPPSKASAALPALEAGRSPRELLEGVRGPGTVMSDVDAFLHALARPPSGGETPRERANLLLSLLEDAEVRDATGSDGRTVRSAAVEGLLALGYPYALEIPPEVLAQARGEGSAHGAQGVPKVGLVLAGLAALAQGVLIGPALAQWLADSHTKGGAGVFFLGAVVLPTLLAVLGGWRRLSFSRWVGVTLMALMGVFYLMRFTNELFVLAPGAEVTWELLTGVPGVLLPAAAWLLRHPWKDAAP